MLTLLNSKKPPYSRDKVLQQLQVWLKDCDQCHLECYNKSPKLLPTRVIDVGSLHRSPYLHISSESETGRYIALSHCWGVDSTGRLMTQKLNIEAFKQDIPFGTIPKTFQDAIIVARYLGIQYIWIDCLCIIQDDPEDWVKESARMCDVYKNAYLTIAADKASGPQAGLFLSETEIKERDSEVNVQMPSGVSYNIIARLYDYGIYPSKDTVSCNPDNTKSHLGRRAWALQEFLLSRRIVQFTSIELIWNCQDNRTCECLQKMERKYVQIKDSWEKTVEEFTSRNITYASDRLPAISGLAEAVGLPSTQYLAGIWLPEIAEQLSWYIDPRKKSTRHLKYHAPSWSWASLTGKVLYFGSESPSFEVVEVSCTPATANAYGPVLAAYIKIRGDLCKIKEFRHEFGYVAAIGFSGQEDIDFRPDIQGDENEMNDPASDYFVLFTKPNTVSIKRRAIFLRRRPSGNGNMERIGIGLHPEIHDAFWEKNSYEEVVTIV